MIRKTRFLAPAALLLTVLAAGCSSSAVSPTPPPPVASHVIPSHPRPAYLAIGQDVRGTRLVKPSCAKGCVLSGDSTTILWHMTWQKWTNTEAVGTGTEELVDCTPSCATGKQYKIAVRVTFSQPVWICVDGGVRLWSRASFAYPNGLPSAFTGGDAPTNPWDFAPIKSAAAASC
jgi:hypothetical protein